jgi:hypothetical protein
MAKRSEQAATADQLQEELRDLLSLAVVSDHARWVLVGDEVSGWPNGWPTPLDNGGNAPNR